MRSIAAILLPAALAFGQTRTPAAEVSHRDKLCVSYRAWLDGPWLVVRAILGDGWHTFAMDNDVRAKQRLAGAASLGIEHPTEINVSGGMRVAGPWYQSPPRDFSRPDLRWFSWGFEKEAEFAVKVVRLRAAAVAIAIRGQACRESICKNVDVGIVISPTDVRPASDRSAVDFKNLVQVKTGK